MTSEHAIITSGTFHAATRVGRVVLVFFRRQPDAAFVRQLSVLMRETARLFPDGFALMIMARPRGGAGTPDEETRNLFKDMFMAVQPQLKWTAWAIEATGFIGAGIRAIVSGLLLANRKNYQGKVFGSGPDALSWLRAQMGDDTVSLAVLDAGVQSLVTAVTAQTGE